MLTFENFYPGRVFISESYTVTREDIVRFALEFDPQSFHTGSTGQTAPLFDTVIASGWHSGALCQRLVVKTYLAQSTCVASPGLDFLRWPAPLVPGDEVRAVSKVLKARLTRSRPNLGIVKIDVSLVTPDGKVVVWMRANVLLATAGAETKKSRSPSPG